MKEITIYKLPKSQASVDRLERALVRLESALAERGTAVARATEADEVLRRLEAVRAKNAALETAARNVHARLDTAIERLGRLLEN